MVLPNIDIINGVTGLEIIVSGYILSFILFFKHARKAPNNKVRKKIILRGIGIFSVFQAWFGVSTSFVLMLFGLPPLGYPAGNPNVGVLGYAWGPALGIPIWTYVALDTYKESNYKKPVQVIVTFIMAILSLIFAILIYSNPSKYAKWEASPGGLPETGIRSTALILLFLMLVIMMIILGPTIIYSGLKTEDRNVKWRKFSLGIGLTIASLFGIIDAALGAEDFGLIGLAIVKAFIFTSVFLIYEGVDKGT
ncbi:MAG: hypothetical protein ACW98D_06395 [Promethearchaeota archaeon]|jgi:hypothetical protein